MPSLSYKASMISFYSTPGLARLHCLPSHFSRSHLWVSSVSPLPGPASPPLSEQLKHQSLGRYPPLPLSLDRPLSLGSQNFLFPSFYFQTISSF